MLLLIGCVVVVVVVVVDVVVVAVAVVLGLVEDPRASPQVRQRIVVQMDPAVGRELPPLDDGFGFVQGTTVDLMVITVT